MTSKSSTEEPRKDDVDELRRTTTNGAWCVTDCAETLVVKRTAAVCALNYSPQTKSAGTNDRKSEKMNLRWFGCVARASYERSTHGTDL